MKKVPLFEDFIPAGFSGNRAASFSLGGVNNIETGYSMDAIVGPVDQCCYRVAEQANMYETNDNPEHTAEAYIKEAKKHINNKIDEACESYSATNEGSGIEDWSQTGIMGNENVFVTGAKILASEIVSKLEISNLLNSSVNINTVRDAVQTTIMDTTF